MNFLAEKCYAQPNEFIPERWFSRSELIKSKNAFASFSLGESQLFFPRLPLPLGNRHQKLPF